MTVSGGGLQPFDGCDVDHAPRLRPRIALHRACSCLRHGEDTADIDPQYLVGLGLIQLEQWHDGLDPGVVDQDIQGPEGRDRPIANRCRIHLDIAQDEGDPGAQALGKGLQRWSIAVGVQGNGCARLMQSPGDRGTDVPACTGDQGNSPAEVKEFRYWRRRHARQAIAGELEAEPGYPQWMDPLGQPAGTDLDDLDAAWLVDHFGMSRLPIESTYYLSTYRSAALTADGEHAGTAIIGLFATSPISRSLFHRLAHDEVWHFYAGDPLRLVLLHPNGTSEQIVLGSRIAAGHRVQAVVPAGVWQAGETMAGGRWSLFGCTMAPGFSGETFESGYADALLDAYPDCRADIERLAVPASEPGSMPTGFA